MKYKSAAGHIDQQGEGSTLGWTFTAPSPDRDALLVLRSHFFQ
jgi:hypothetical protein